MKAIIWIFTFIAYKTVYAFSGAPYAPSGSTYPPPPPPGYTSYGQPAPPAGQAPPGQGYVPNYGSTTTHIIMPPPIITVGGCPACRVGILEEEFTCLGIMCAIFFFPIGILCCLLFRNRRCTNCGAYFG